MSTTKKLVSSTYEEKPKAENAAQNMAATTPNAIALTYMNPNGQYVTGYSIDNKMYKDAAGTQRIDNGSVVTNQSGTQAWVMTDNGGVPYGEYYANQAQNNTNLQAAQQKAMAAANQRLEADLMQIEAQRPKIDNAYNQLQQQNYQAYVQGQKALANQLASQGLYNSGYSDTAKVAQNVGYRANQNETERARLQAIADLETEINAARLNGSANLAELEAEYNILLNEQANYDREFAYSAAQDLMANQRYQNEFNYEKERDRIADERYDAEWKQALVEWAKKVEWTDAEMQSDAAQRAFDNALTMAGNGDFSALDKLGYDTSGLRTLWNDTLEASRLDLATKNQNLALGQLEMEAYQREAEREKNALGSIYGGADVSSKFDDLYKEDAKTYEYVISLARQFAENQYGVPESSFMSQVDNNAALADRMYGDGFGDLYRQVVLQNRDNITTRNAEAYGYTTFDPEIVDMWKDNIFKTTTVRTDIGGNFDNSYTQTQNREVINAKAQEDAAWELLAYYANEAISWSEAVRYAHEIGLSTSEFENFYNAYRN